jgi:hypothetical protein
MAKAVLIAFSSPASTDAEAEFNDWYERTHIPQVRAAIPAIGQVARYRTVDLTGADAAPRYITVYEIDGGDVASAAAALGAAGQSGRLDQTPAMDVTVNPPVLVWGEPA